MRSYRFRRAMDDDEHAPLDYQTVHSVREGERQRQQEALRQRQGMVVRHRAVPGEGPARADDYGTRARQPYGQAVPPRPAPREAAVVRRTLDDRPVTPAEAWPEAPVARRVADDRPVTPAEAWPKAPVARRLADDRPVTPAEAWPEAPVARRLADDRPVTPASREAAPLRHRGQAAAAPEADRRAALAREPFAQPAAAPAQTGDAFAPPAPPEVPEWYRVAQQNAPIDSRRAAAPRVQRAPRAEEDDDAPYPEAVYEGLDAREREELRRQAPPAHDRPFFVRERRDARPGEGYAPPPPKAWGEPTAAARRPAEAGGAYERMHAQAERRERPRYEQPGAAYPGDLAYAPPPREPRASRDPRAEREEPTEAPARRDFPWLGLAAGVMCLLAVILWLVSLNAERQTASILEARAEAEAALQRKYSVTLVEDGATEPTSRFDTYRALIEREAAANNLHPAFVAAIIYNESTFRPGVESGVGARGLMQMMEDTAQWVADKSGYGDGYTFDLMYDPATNVRFACWYLAFLSEKFHADPVLVSAAFHAGQGTVTNWLNDSQYSADSRTIQLEKMADGPTKQYATRVLAAYAAYKRLFYETVAQP